jgi:hypothetical protein
MIANSLMPTSQAEIPCGAAVRPGGKWNRKSRKTRKDGDASQAQDDTFDLQARLAEVE